MGIRGPAGTSALSNTAGLWAPCPGEAKLEARDMARKRLRLLVFSSVHFLSGAPRREGRRCPVTPITCSRLPGGARDDPLRAVKDKNFFVRGASALDRPAPMADGSPFGMKGTEGALIPSAPREASVESVSDDHRKLLDDLGFVGFAATRAAEREESDSEFTAATGSSEGRMDEQMFLDTVEMRWGLNRAAAEACFQAGDLDRSGRINMEEYLLLREAFVHKTPHNEHPEIRRLRLSAIYHRYNRDADGKLTPNELLEWLRGAPPSPHTSPSQRDQSVGQAVSTDRGRDRRRGGATPHLPPHLPRTPPPPPPPPFTPATSPCPTTSQTSARGTTT